MTIELEFLPADVLGLSPLSRRLLSERPASEAAPGLIVPARIEQIPEVERDDLELFVERLELVDRLRERSPDAPVGVARSLEKLKDPRSLAVVCGQQPGLAGGPLYNLYKALHACRLAAALEERFARPVVPIFWNHADDQDLSQVNHAFVLNRHLDVARASLAGLGSGRRPYGQIVLDDERHRVGAFLENLRNLLPKRESRDANLERFAPRTGEALSAGFTRAMTHLLGHRGLLVVEPSDLRPGATRALAKLVPLDIAEAVATAEARLQEQGLGDPEFGEHAWAFLHEPDGRHPLRWIEGGFRRDKEPGSRTGAELAAEMTARQHDWSPGALLRPLVQDLCLPTVAYVGGHGELAYHALLPELRRRAGLPAAVFVPRLSATLVSPAASASAAKAGLGVADILRTRGASESAGQGTQPPDPIAERILEITQEFAQAIDQQRKPLSELDRALSMRLRQSTRRATKLIQAVARKIERVQKNRAGKDERHLRRLQNCWYPRGAPQERRFTALQYVTAFGSDWIDSLYEHLDPLPTEHLVVRLPNQPGPSGEPAAE